MSNTMFLFALCLLLDAACLAGCASANVESCNLPIAIEKADVFNPGNVDPSDVAGLLDAVRKAEKIRIGYARRRSQVSTTFAFDVSRAEALVIKQAFLDSNTVFDGQFWVDDEDDDCDPFDWPDCDIFRIIFCDSEGNMLRSVDIEYISDHQSTRSYSDGDGPAFWIIMPEVHFHAVMQIVEKYRRMFLMLNKE